MRVEACMSSDVRVVSPTETIRNAAQTMKRSTPAFFRLARMIGSSA